MDTLKTAVIVVLLLAVVYGAYVVLNKPAAPLPQEIAWHEQKSAEPLQIDMGTSKDGAPKVKAGSASKFDSAWSTPASPGVPGKPFIHAELSPEEPPANPPVPSAGIVSGRDPLSKSGSFAPNTPSESYTPAVPSQPTVSAPNLLLSDSSSEPKKNATANDAASRSSLPSLPQLRKSTTSDESPVGDLNTLSEPGKAGSTTSSVEPLPSNNTSPPKETPPDSLLPPSRQPASNSDGGTSKSPDNVSETGGSGTSVRALNGFEAALREARSQIENGEWFPALSLLSKFVQNADLTKQQHQQLLDLLDPLAAKVVYSTEHLVEPPYEVRRGDTLSKVAEYYQVPWELLANINGIENPDLLVPGTKLKVLRGPFRADVDLQSNELTLFVGQLYAGKFPISLGKDPPPKPGEYRVLEKQRGRVYYAGDGRTIPADDPRNPYGEVWIGIGTELSIHGSAASGDGQGLGCISLSPLDASDVYSILSQGSSVVIRR